MSYDEETDYDEERTGRFSPERILSAVWRRWPIVVLVTALVTAIAATLVSMMPSRYEGTAVVQVDPRRKSISNFEGVLSDLTPSHTTVESEVEVISSRSIATKVIDLLNLRADPEFNPAISAADAIKGAPSAAITDDPISRLLEVPAPGVSEPERDVVAAVFASRLKVSRVRVTLLLEIKFTSPDPVKAAKIANTIAEVYLKEQVEEKQKAASYATELLEKKLESLKGKVELAERRVEDFKAKNNIFDSSGGVLSEKQLTQQMAQAQEARNATSTAKAKYEQVQALIASGQGSGTIAEVLQSDSIRVRKDALASATRREAELETRYGPKHPEIQKVRAELAEAAAQLDAEIRRVVGNLKTEYELALDKERKIEENFSGLKEQQVLTREASVTLTALQREAATEKQLFEALLGRYKQTAETQNLQLPDSRIVERADVPLSPSAPKRKQLILMAFAASLLASLALVLGLEFFTPGIANIEDIKPALKLEHLASVPRLAASQTDKAVRALRMIIAEPRGLYAESIRAARHEIDSRSRNGQPRIIMIASSLPNEDADIIASNLAHQYALVGRKVLLVDGDLRRAALTRRLAPKAELGLLEVMNRNVDFQQAVLLDSTTGLSFLPAMRDNSLEVANPEMLASARMAATFTFMKRRYDTIVVTSPPVLPVIDARLLAEHADQIVFVMTWRRTPKEMARRALKALGLSQQKIAGIVMNHVDTNDLPDVGRVATVKPRDPRQAA